MNSNTKNYTKAGQALFIGLLTANPGLSLLKNVDVKKMYFDLYLQVTELENNDESFKKCGASYVKARTLVLGA